MATSLTWKNDAGATVAVTFDVVSTETHELLNAITEHPVEQGPNISDHIRPQLDHISLEAYVSNKPLFSNPGVETFMDFEQLKLDLPEKKIHLTVQGAEHALTGAIRDAFGGGVADQATVLVASTFRSRVRDMYDALRDARDKGRLIRIVTAVHDYDQMAIERLAIPRSVNDGTGATFQVDLKQILTVTAQTVQAPEPAEKRGQLSKSLGSVHGSKDDNDAKKSEHAKSIAARLFDGASGGLKDAFSL